VRRVGKFDGAPALKLDYFVRYLSIGTPQVMSQFTPLLALFPQLIQFVLQQHFGQFFDGATQVRKIYYSKPISEI
jgi:hypothetical protein